MVPRAMGKKQWVTAVPLLTGEAAPSSSLLLQLLFRASQFLFPSIDRIFSLLGDTMHSQQFLIVSIFQAAERALQTQPLPAAQKYTQPRV